MSTLPTTLIGLNRPTVDIDPKLYTELFEEKVFRRIYYRLSDEQIASVTEADLNRVLTALEPLIRSLSYNPVFIVPGVDPSDIQAYLRLYIWRLLALGKWDGGREVAPFMKVALRNFMIDMQRYAIHLINTGVEPTAHIIMDELDLEFRATPESDPDADNELLEALISSIEQSDYQLLPLLWKVMDERGELNVLKNRWHHTRTTLRLP